MLIRPTVLSKLFWESVSSLSTPLLSNDNNNNNNNNGYLLKSFSHKLIGKIKTKLLKPCLAHSKCSVSTCQKHLCLYLSILWAWYLKKEGCQKNCFPRKTVGNCSRSSSHVPTWISDCCSAVTLAWLPEGGELNMLTPFRWSWSQTWQHLGGHVHRKDGGMEMSWGPGWAASY